MLNHCVAIAFLVAAAIPAAASDRAGLIEAFGALSIAPKLCRLQIDPDRLADLQGRLVDGATRVEISKVNSRIAAEYRLWTESRRKAFCDITTETVTALGLLAR